MTSGAPVSRVQEKQRDLEFEFSTTLLQKLVRTVKMHEGKAQSSGLGSPEWSLGGGANRSVSITRTTVNYRPHIEAPQQRLMSHRPQRGRRGFYLLQEVTTPAAQWVRTFHHPEPRFSPEQPAQHPPPPP